MGRVGVCRRAGGSEAIDGFDRGGRLVAGHVVVVAPFALERDDLPVVFVVGRRVEVYNRIHRRVRQPEVNMASPDVARTVARFRAGGVRFVRTSTFGHLS